MNLETACSTTPSLAVASAPYVSAALLPLRHPMLPFLPPFSFNSIFLALTKTDILNCIRNNDWEEDKSHTELSRPLLHFDHKYNLAHARKRKSALDRDLRKMASNHQQHLVVKH